MKLTSRALLLTSLLFSAHALAQQPTARQIAEQVDRYYNKLHSMKADFTETYSGAGIDRSESGVLYLKKPGRMRWEYKEPREKLFISDGQSAYFFVDGEPEARKVPLNKVDDLRSPLRYLLGKTKLEKEFDRLELVPTAPGSSTAILRGVPRSMADRVRLVELEIDKENQIVRLQINENDGATTEFRFSGVVRDPALSQSLFQFIPPVGVQVIEGEAFQK